MVPVRVVSASVRTTKRYKEVGAWLLPPILRLAAILLFLLSVIAWIRVVMPGMRMFADHIRVANETDEPIDVTPAAYSFHERRRVPMPELSRGVLNLPVLRPVHTIPPHEAVTLSFDADDHGLSDLLVEGRSGGPRWLPLSNYPTGSPLEQPEGSTWVIHSLTELQPAPDWLRSIRWAAWWRAFCLGFAHLAFLPGKWLLLLARRMSAV
jgi:hypothetical protein